MSATDQLNPAEHAWLSAPATRAVMHALSAARPDAQPHDVARFVGGCVRNAVWGVAVDDVDIATVLTPEETLAALEAAGLKSVATGLAHGTVTAVSEGKAFEITTLRRDVETDGRTAVVAFTADWAEDAARRDFRVNALYADLDGRIYDPVGGLEDSAARRIRFIGDPHQRIAEDYLRILRFFRFAAWYGDPQAPLDAEALAACQAGVRGMRRLSAERVWKELKKLLSAPHPGPAVDAMAETGVLDQVLPEAFALDLFRALIALEAREEIAPDPMLRLEALVPRLADVARRLARRLKMSNAEAERLASWAREDVNPRVFLAQDEAQRARGLYALDREAVHDRTLLAWAIDAARAPEETDAAAYRHLADFVASWERPQFPLKGADLVEAGVPKGPGVGLALKALEALWVRGGFMAGRAELLEALPLVQR